MAVIVNAEKKTLSVSLVFAVKLAWAGRGLPNLCEKSVVSVSQMPRTAQRTLIGPAMIHLVSAFIPGP